MDDQLALAVKPWFQRFADALADEIARIDEQLAKLVVIRETPGDQAMTRGVSHEKDPETDPPDGSRRERWTVTAVPRPMDHVEWSMELTVRDLMWRSSTELDAEMTKLATRVSADLLDDLLRALAFRAVRGGWGEIRTLVADQRSCDAIGAIAVVVDKAGSRELAKPEYDELRACLQPYDLVVVDQFPRGSDWQQASALILPMPTNAQLHRVLPPTLGWRRSGETQARFVVTSRSALELGQPAIAIVIATATATAAAAATGSLGERVGDPGLTLSTGRGRRRR